MYNRQANYSVSHVTSFTWVLALENSQQQRYPLGGILSTSYYQQLRVQQEHPPNEGVIRGRSCSVNHTVVHVYSQ